MNTNKKIILAIVIIFIVFIVLIASTLFLQPGNSNYTFTRPQAPTPTNIEQPYSFLNQLSPGRSTIADVDNIAGKPTSIKKVGDKTYLYYNTPVSGLKNSVLLINNVVYYIYEHVFGNYRGTYNDFLKNYGVPDFVLYNQSGAWHVFLSKGVVVQANNNLILELVYFLPQGEEAFYKNVAADLGLTKKNLQNSSGGEVLPTPQP